jgi:hypothetical protein
MMRAGIEEGLLMVSPKSGSGRRVVDRDHVSLREMARRQGVRPVESADDLAADGVFDSDEELDEFLAAVAAWRHSDLG